MNDKSIQELVAQAASIWATKRSKMTVDDWIAVGKALIAGREWCANTKGYGGDKGFGKWCKENGFRDIQATHRSDAIWLASSEGSDFFFTTIVKKNIHHPQAIRAAYRAQNEAAVKDKKSAITGLILDSKKPVTASDIAKQLGVSQHYVSKGLTGWESTGVIERVPDTKPIQYRKPSGETNIATSHEDKRRKELADVLARAQHSMARAAEILATTGSSTTARQWLKEATPLQWGPLSTNVTQAVKDGLISREVTDSFVTTEGATGGLVYTALRLEIRDE